MSAPFRAYEGGDHSCPPTSLYITQLVAFFWTKGAADMFARMVAWDEER